MPAETHNLLYRRCSGPCGRVLMFDPTDTRPAITSHCSSCERPVTWTITAEPRRGGHAKFRRRDKKLNAQPSTLNA